MLVCPGIVMWTKRPTKGGVPLLWAGMRVWGNIIGMRNAVSIALGLMLVAFASESRALEVGSSPTYSGLSSMQGDGHRALNSSSIERTSVQSGLTIDGSGMNRGGGMVNAAGAAKKAYALGYAKGRKSNLVVAASGVPAPDGKEAEPGFKIPNWAVYGGAAVLGAVQGFFSGGPIGAVIGMGLGLAGAHLFKKGNYGASIGITVGAMIGTMFGGPIGAIIGGLIGGLIGHFIGKLFSGKKDKK